MKRREKSVIVVSMQSVVLQQGRAATIGVIAIVLLGVFSVSKGNTATVTSNVVDIGIEHKKPLSLSFEIGVLDSMATAEFIADSDETISISVPSTWKRHEVQNASIEDVTSDPPSLGFTRWHLPAGAGISFRILSAPESILIHNPSEVPLKLDVVRVDLMTEEVVRETVLIQSDTTKLW